MNRFVYFENVFKERLHLFWGLWKTKIFAIEILLGHKSWGIKLNVMDLFLKFKFVPHILCIDSLDFRLRYELCVSPGSFILNIAKLTQFHSNCAMLIVFIF